MSFNYSLWRRQLIELPRHVTSGYFRVHRGRKSDANLKQKQRIRRRGLLWHVFRNSIRMQMTFFRKFETIQWYSPVHSSISRRSTMLDQFSYSPWCSTWRCCRELNLQQTQSIKFLINSQQIPQIVAVIHMSQFAYRFPHQIYPKAFVFDLILVLRRLFFRAHVNFDW